jgi:hypothetical protein
MSQFCSFFGFFSSFPANLFLGVLGLFFGLFQGGATFDLLAGFRVSGLAPMSGGAFRGLCFLPLIRCKNRGGLLCYSGGVCLSLSASRTSGGGACLHGSKLSGIALAATFEQVFRTSVQKPYSNKFSKQVFEWQFDLGWQNFQPNLTEF